MNGWVYVISNKAMLGLVKVGYTTKDPELRADELNHTGSPYPYIVEYEVLIEDPYQVEQRVHRRLASLFMEVEDIARRNGLDIDDAYQIVTIKKDYFSRLPHSRPILVTADSGLAKAAGKEGLRVWDCLTEQPP